jgi:hypothetical protein
LFDRIASIGFGTQTGFWMDSTNANTAKLRPVLDAYVVHAYRCPSTIMPRFRDVTAVSPARMMVPAYANIAGSNLHVTTDHNGANGSHCSAGGLFPGSVARRLAEATDGTSNTIMLGEQSNWIAGVKNTFRTAFSASGPWMGIKNSRLPKGDGTWSSTGAHASSPSDTDMRSFSMTTIRDAPNPRGTATYMNEALCNTPLASAHPGGVQAALADGSVRFLTDNINLTTFKNLADCDDGNAIGEF